MESAHDLQSVQKTRSTTSTNRMEDTIWSPALSRALAKRGKAPGQRQSARKIQSLGVKCGRKRVAKARLVLSLCASFLDQTHSVLEQRQHNPRLYTIFFSYEIHSINIFFLFLG